MKSMKKKTLSFLLTAAMIAAMLPAAATPVYADTDLDVDLGEAVQSGDAAYHYPSAEVTGDEIRTILISFSGNITSGDTITLPSDTPIGFSVSASSASNAYAKRINVCAGTSPDDIEAYLQEVEFTVAGGSQSVEVTVTTEDISRDTYYNSDNRHYYQYIEDTSSSWLKAYTDAEAMTYMGRTGYLATITSLEEDKFVNTLSNGKTGWLGGTILSNSAITTNSIYYTNFLTDSAISTGWYWACGPEIGSTFFQSNSLHPHADSSGAASADADSSSTYFNWARGTVSYEPNNQTATVSPTSGDYETCLTTLVITNNSGKHGTTFSWNDKAYNTAGSGTWDAKGYFVEYGDQMTGDSGNGSSSFASDNNTLKPACKVELGDVTWLDTASYSLDVDLTSNAKMVTLSVDSGYFTVPSLTSALTFLGGTGGTTYYNAYSSATHYSSAVFSFTNESDAEAALGNIRYCPNGSDTQTVTATASKVSPLSGDIFFQGHFYRYVPISGSINWINAVLAAGATSDPYFGGRGYIATAVSQPENSILLRLTDTGGVGGDHWYDAWMGGLWQRNSGSVSAPAISRGTDGHEISYADLSGATSSERQNMLIDYTIQGNGFSTGNAATHIYNNPLTVKYYWIDGPEAGQEIANNTAEFAPWHVTSGAQDEPNGGDFVYIGWEGAYWDDLSTYSSDNTGSGYAKLSGYIVEFSGFHGGVTTGIIDSDIKNIKADNQAPALTAGTVNRTSDTGGTVKFTSDESGRYYYGVVSDGATAPAIDISGAGVACSSGENTVTLTTLTAGAMNLYIKAKDAAPFYNISNTIKIDIPAYIAPDVPAGSSHHGQPAPANSGAPVIVNGTSYSAGDAKESMENGKTATTVTVDTGKLQTVLDAQGENPSVIVPISGTSEIASGILTGQMIRDMENRNATLSLRTDSVTYTVPASEINIKAVSDALGENLSLSDITVNLRISEPSAETVTIVENAAQQGGFAVVLPAIDFDISCTHGGKSIDAKVFNVYVKRTVLIPEGVDPARITTGIVVKSDGTSYHVPTEVTQINGKYYAVINSLTNSTYTVIWHPTEFSDAAAHWAKTAINDMGSRMVVNGVSPGTFEPDRAITRAEFAAIVVRALGLDTGMGSETFSDINVNDWYSGYIKTAAGYNIIKGYGDGTFGPQERITREQAMTMIARAMSVTGLEYDTTAAQQALSSFADSSFTSDWAKDGAAACIQTGLINGRTASAIAPKADISRAEVAVIVQRLLKESKLI